MQNIISKVTVAKATTHAITINTILPTVNPLLVLFNILAFIGIEENSMSNQFSFASLRNNSSYSLSVINLKLSDFKVKFAFASCKFILTMCDKSDDKE